MLYLQKSNDTHTYREKYHVKYPPISRSTGCGRWFCSWGTRRTLWPGRSSSSPPLWGVSLPPAWQSSDSSLCPWCRTSRDRGNGSASSTSLCQSWTQLQEGRGCDKRGCEINRERDMVENTHLICRGDFEWKPVKITKIVPSLGLSVITSLLHINYSHSTTSGLKRMYCFEKRRPVFTEGHFLNSDFWILASVTKVESLWQLIRFQVNN